MKPPLQSEIKLSFTVAALHAPTHPDSPRLWDELTPFDLGNPTFLFGILPRATILTRKSLWTGIPTHASPRVTGGRGANGLQSQWTSSRTDCGVLASLRI